MSSASPPDSRRRRLRVAEILGWLFVAALLGGAIGFAVDAGRRSRQFNRWVADVPTNFAVDLSKPGRTTATFRQTCDISHSEVLLLRVETDVSKTGDPAELLDGLAGRIAIVDRSGREVFGEVLEDQPTYEPQPAGFIGLTRFHPFPVGDYTIRLDVRHGAPALAGRRQTLLARYEFCGIEQMPVLASEFFALVTAVPGLILATVLIFQRVRRSRSSVPVGS